MAAWVLFVLTMLLVRGVTAFTAQPLRRTNVITTWKRDTPCDANAYSNLFKEADGATSRPDTKSLLEALHKALPPGTALHIGEIVVGNKLLLRDELEGTLVAKDFQHAGEGEGRRNARAARARAAGKRSLADCHHSQQKGKG